MKLLNQEDLCSGAQATFQAGQSSSGTKREIGARCHALRDTFRVLLFAGNECILCFLLWHQQISELSSVELTAQVICSMLSSREQLINIERASYGGSMPFGPLKSSAPLCCRSWFYGIQTNTKVCRPSGSRPLSKAFGGRQRGTQIHGNGKKAPNQVCEADGVLLQSIVHSGGDY